ncbi:hypothetical protein C8F04DRAFT_1190589 [Mycena alexandri]|uniref:Uncharacterized protein n=1 Tax=Mycena alexandri TaxID=1745969 RepID=A0AAD6SEB0_9AGAR|nr:hypothetical protein C8F04DRAFT_1190589 [Mycena alexandri]
MNLVDDLVAKILEEALDFRGRIWWQVALDRRNIATLSRDWQAKLYTNFHLWSNIPVRRAMSERYVAFLGERAARGPVILDISTESTGTKDCTMTELVETRLPLLRPVFARAKAINIQTVDYSQWLQIAAVIGQYNAPNVTSALHSVASGLWLGEGELPFPECVWIHCVRTLRLQSVPPLWITTGAYSSLRQLRLVRVTDISWPRLRDSLVSAAQVEVFEIKDVCCFTPAFGTPITMPNVADFYLGYGDDETAELLSGILLPGLRRLMVDAYSYATLQPLLEEDARVLRTAIILDIGVVEPTAGHLLLALCAMEGAVEIDVRRCGDQALDVCRSLGHHPQYKPARLERLVVQGELSVEVVRAWIAKASPHFTVISLAGFPIYGYMRRTAVMGRPDEVDFVQLEYLGFWPDR